MGHSNDDSLENCKLVRLSDDGERLHLSNRYHDKDDIIPISLFCQDMVDPSYIIRDFEEVNLYRIRVEPEPATQLGDLRISEPIPFGFLCRFCFSGAQEKLAKK